MEPLVYFYYFLIRNIHSCWAFNFIHYSIFWCNFGKGVGKKNAVKKIKKLQYEIVSECKDTRCSIQILLIVLIPMRTMWCVFSIRTVILFLLVPIPNLIHILDSYSDYQKLSTKFCILGSWLFSLMLFTKFIFLLFFWIHKWRKYLLRLCANSIIFFFT